MEDRNESSSRRTWVALPASPKKLFRVIPSAPAVRATAWTILTVLFCLGLLSSLPVGDNTGDLGSFIASGRAAIDGLNPYAVYPLTFSGPFRHRAIPAPNLNPPVLLPLFEALARLDPRTVSRGWYGGSLILYALALILLAGAYRRQVTPLRVIWLFSLAGLWNTLELGQIYVPLLLACTTAWLSLRQGRYVLAGVPIGVLVAIKPNFAVWPILLFLTGYRIPALSAFVSVILVSLLPLLIYDPHVYADWVQAVSSHSTLSVLPGNLSLPGFTARLGMTWFGSWLGVALFVAIAAWVWYRRPSILEVSSLALVVALLASPIAWVGYSLLLLPIFFEQRWTPPLALAAALLLVPMWVIWPLSQISSGHLVAFGAIYTVAVSLLLIVVVKGTIRGGGARNIPNPVAARSRRPRAMSPPLRRSVPAA